MMKKPLHPHQQESSAAPVIIAVAIVLALALLMLGVGFYFLASSNRAPNRPNVVVASTAEVAVDASGRTDAARRDSRNNLSKTISKMHSGPAISAVRSIAVLSRSDHALSRRVAEALANELKADKSLRVHDHSAGAPAQPGAFPTDWYVSVDLKSAKHSGPTLDAKLLVSFGSRLAQGNYSYNDSFTPPVVLVHGDIRIDHHSTSRRTLDALPEYAAQSRSIARETAESIRKTLDELQKDEVSPRIELPPELYPAWRPAPDFAFLEEFQAQPLHASRGLMSRNRTYWRLDSEKKPQLAMTEIRKHLQAKGWKGGGQEALGNFAHLRMSKGGRLLEVFQPDKRYSNRQADSQQKPLLYAYYNDRMTPEEIEPVIRKMLAESADMRLLLAMRRYASKELRQQILDRAEADPAPSISALFALAEHYAGLQDKAKATKYLNYLHHLQFAESGPSETADKIRSHIQKLGLDRAKVEKFDLKLFAQLGFQTLKSDAPQSQEVQLGQAAKFLWVEDEKEFLAFAVTPRRSKTNPQGSCYLVELAYGGPNQGRSRSWIDGIEWKKPYRHQLDANGRPFAFLVKSLDDRKLCVTVSVRADTRIRNASED